MSRYGNPLSFQHVGDTDINEVEIEMKKTDPSFKFQPGDKKLIKAIADHVNDIFNKYGLKEGVAYFMKDESNKEKSIANVVQNINVPEHSFLSELLLTIENNSKAKNEHGYRYNRRVQFLSAYLRMLSGPLAYETIQRNLPRALPSLVSTNRYIRNSGCDITLGILRTHELRNYIDERSLDPVVCLSEDGTRIIGRIQYDSKSNQLIGFVLPLNESTGMPIPFTYPATSLEEIFKHFSNDNPIATNMNVIMAQPVGNAPPFCLLIFGTDNRYTGKHVAGRWQFIVKELAKVGISVLTISSDSATPYNSAMHRLSALGEKSKFEWYSSNENIECPFYIQDSVHIATKMRNFILATLYALKVVPFGKYFIRLSHLHELIARFPKDAHQLTGSTLNACDRQNFSSVSKMCDDKVVTLLRDRIKSSAGTAQYLQLIRDIIDSFMSTTLAPLQRIRKIWYSLFLVRIWRQFIVSSDQYKLKENFISANCYTCIELNAHSMVKCLLYLKKIDKPSYFKPHVFDSQACESMFRSFRSLTSTYSTVVNCTLKEATNRVSKIGFQNQIVQTTSDHFVYPRTKTTSTHKTPDSLPTMEQIANEIQFCHKLAIATASKLGLIVTKREKNVTYSCKIRPYRSKREVKLPKKNTNSNVKVNLYKLKLSDFKNIQLKNYAGKISPASIDATSPYIDVQFSKSKPIIIKKTSLCWLLGTDCPKMSSDRLLRVQYSLTKQPIHKSKQKRKPKHH